jgi:hypothetical protein
MITSNERKNNLDYRFGRVNQTKVQDVIAKQPNGKYFKFTIYEN